MFDRIVLAVDGSEHAGRAVGVAADLAKGGGEVHAIHVHEVGIVASIETSSEAKKLVDGVVGELQNAGVRASGSAIAARAGSVAPAILDAAKTFDANLIVLGTRGLSDFAGLLLGSVAHKVIHHAECPVLVVR
ncbi:MAG TPA: universal stress protein [Actinomycetota bacterium]